MARGGERVGSGRKPKGTFEAGLHGSRGNVAGRPAAGPSRPLQPVQMPENLPAEQAEVWAKLAPHALQARTLTLGMVEAFRDLCEAIVLKRAMLERIERDGLTYLKVTVDGSGQEHQEMKAHPLISQHRGMMQRVEAGMKCFKLAPIGREVAVPEPPADPFAEFEDGSVQ